jgi:hypothetical protein
MDEKLGHYPVSVTIPVAWGEMDAFQILDLEATAPRSRGLPSPRAREKE